MTGKLQGSSKPWIDREDAPELCDDFFEKGVWKVGDKMVSRHAARVEAAKLRAASPARGGRLVRQFKLMLRF